jgi:hypothetical protein
MELIKVTALRDFAIDHLPRAQKVSRAMPPDQFHTTLYGLTALISPTAPASQQAAAELLQTVLSLLIEWGDDVKLTTDQRRFAERGAIQQATELAALTGHVISWLPTLPSTVEPVQQATPASAPLAAASEASPQPAQLHGKTQTTKVAAKFLGVTEQTMRTWASKDNGPLVPIKHGRRNGWLTEDLIRIDGEGWTARGRKKASR